MIHLVRKLHQRFLNQIHFKSEKYSTQESVYLFTLYMSILMVSVTSITNYALDLPIQVKWLAYISGIILIALYFLARHRNRFDLSQKFFFIMAVIALNILWLYTEGSAGAAVFILHALLPLIALYSNKKQAISKVIIIVINIFLLHVIEIFYPHLIQPYPSSIFRSIDVLTISFFFMVFEVPALIFVNQLMLNAKDKAEQANAAKTSYITNLSHEIRTPMNAILGFTELLSDPDLNKDEHDHYLSIVNQNGRQLLNLLNNIINISKLEAKQANVSIVEFHPIDVLKQIQDTMLPYFQDNQNITLKISPDNNNGNTIMSDPALIYQILINLTFNAVKFTQKGCIEIGYRKQAEIITYFVKDTGIGIPYELHASIFDRYKQVKSHAGLSPVQGSGLGLAICKGLTELLGGEITFTSQLNSGTSFNVKIPFTVQS